MGSPTEGDHVAGGGGLFAGPLAGGTDRRGGSSKETEGRGTWTSLLPALAPVPSSLLQPLPQTSPPLLSCFPPSFSSSSSLCSLSPHRGRRSPPPSACSRHSPSTISSSTTTTAPTSNNNHNNHPTTNNNTSNFTKSRRLPKLPRSLSWMFFWLALIK